MVTKLLRRLVATPGIHEETKDRPSRTAVQDGPSVARNWCTHRSCQAGGTSERSLWEPVCGQLAPHAASVLMKILRGARVARSDLLRQVNRLARNVSRWTVDNNKRLHHLMRVRNAFSFDSDYAIARVSETEKLSYRQLGGQCKHPVLDARFTTAPWHVQNTYFWWPPEIFFMGTPKIEYLECHRMVMAPWRVRSSHLPHRVRYALNPRVGLVVRRVTHDGHLTYPLRRYTARKRTRFADKRSYIHH